MNKQYTDVPVYPTSPSFLGDDNWGVLHTARVEVEPKLNVTEDDLKNGNISVIDAVRILVSANAIDWVKAERETARKMALVKVKSEFIRLGRDAFFAGIVLDPEDIITFYAKTQRPVLGNLAVYETAIKEMWSNQAFLQEEFVRILTSPSKAQ